MRCSVMQCVDTCWGTSHPLVQCDAVCYRGVKCVAVCRSVMHCAAQCSSVSQCVDTQRHRWTYCGVCCSVMQCVAVRCIVLQWCCNMLTHWGTSHPIAVCCSVLQYTLVRCIVLQWCCNGSHTKAPRTLFYRHCVSHEQHYKNTYMYMDISSCIFMYLYSDDAPSEP